MDGLSLQLGQDRYRSFVRVANPQCGLRGDVLDGQESNVRGGNPQCGLRMNPLGVHGHRQSSTLEHMTLSMQSELHSRIRGYACDRVIVTRLGDDEVKLSEMSHGLVPDLTDPHASFQWHVQLRTVEVWIAILLNRDDAQCHRDIGFICDAESMGSLRLTILI